ncbi:MAG: mechanosensitive ion channel family protein [Salinarimonadaceae bacterium]|nr:MAG: mechanosensitive ion channel family protein [Salinarimonadaceae bacterium]
MTTASALLTSFAILSLAAAVGVLAHNFLFRLLRRLADERGLFWRALVTRTRWLLLLALLIFSLAVASRVAPLTAAGAGFLRHMLLICFIVFLAWAAQVALHAWIIVYLRRFKLDAKDNLLARKHVTQARILERVAVVLIVLVGLSAALMTFEGVRQYGISLLASAGAAGIIVGLALQPLLKNLFAGIQLAITQPIRLDDAVIVEGEWGNVEEITSTYVVVRIWDLRRLILPLSYFIEQPFQNWTREQASLLGSVMIYLDYAVPVSAIREKVKEIAAASPLWDGKVAGVQVTDFRETVMELRILVSAGNAGQAFDLRCEVREKLIAFLVETYPNSLPRVRAELPDRSATRRQEP